MIKFCDSVTKQSDGALTIKFLGGPEVIPGTNQAQAVLSGVADMSLHNMEQLVPEASVWNLSRLSEAEEKSGGFWDFMQALYKKAGFITSGNITSTRWILPDD